jgi:uncharacterized protein
MLVKESNALFPIFLKLEKLSILIVGGGNVALEKLTAVLTNSPLTAVRLVGASISYEIKQLSLEYPLIHLEERPFENSDVEGVDLVIIAINDTVKSEEIRNVAKEANKLVNAADKPELCDFYLSSVVQKGNVKIAISTNGKSPTIAKRLREVLNHAIPPEIDEVAENLQVIRTRLNGNFAYKVKKLNKLTKSLVENENEEKEKWRRIATYIVAAFGLMILGHFIFSYIPLQFVADKTITFYESLDKAFLLMILAGFLAQMVDGATSMGYGVTSAIVLMSANVSPAAISGSIHTAEMFTSGASGYSHYKFGNVNKKMFKALVIPGVLGAILGAVLLVNFGETHIRFVRPLMACYTLFLGIKIFINAFKASTIRKKFRHYGWLAGAGGFLDSFGGGGWGPLVTATLITKGRTPRFVVGSVSD